MGACVQRRLVLGAASDSKQTPIYFKCDHPLWQLKRPFVKIHSTPHSECGSSRYHTVTHIRDIHNIFGTPWVGSPLAFRTVSILCSMKPTRYWKHSSEMLVHIHMTASHSCCWFVKCTSMMQISLFHHIAKVPGAISRWYTVGIKGWTWSATIVRLAVAYGFCFVGLEEPKACQEKIPHINVPAAA